MKYATVMIVVMGIMNMGILEADQLRRTGLCNYVRSLGK
jgi:hypothetical protein